MASSPPPNPNPRNPSILNPNPNQNRRNPNPNKRKRNLPGTPDPTAQVISLSPETLLSTATFTCEICSKSFRRHQNLHIHLRGHNLPCKLLSNKKEAKKMKQESSTTSKKRVYVCPVEGCVYHEAARALGDLTGIKKHYRRKHGGESEKRWECGNCGKKYAVEIDWKAHRRVCGRREFECRGCQTLFARKESYVIHKASCKGTAEESDEGCDLAKTTLGTVDLGCKGNTVNTELLFPSLWGRATASVGDEVEQRGNGLL